MCKDVIGGHRGVVGLLSNEELDVPESERAEDGIGAALSVLAQPEEEEVEPVEFSGGDISWGGSLGGGVQRLYDIKR